MQLRGISSHSPAQRLMILQTGMVRRIYVHTISSKSETNQTTFERLHHTYLHNTRSFICKTVLHIDHILAENIDKKDAKTKHKQTKRKTSQKITSAQQTLRQHHQD